MRWSLRSGAGSALGFFSSSDFRQTAEMALGLTVLRRQKRLHQVPRDGRPDRTASHADDIHVIVFHTLPGGEVIVNEAGTRA
jgi:hypothetical protein